MLYAFFLSVAALKRAVKRNQGLCVTNSTADQFWVDDFIKPNGDLKAEKTYNDGNVDVASIKEFEPKKPIVKIKESPVDNAPKIVLKPDEKPNGVASKGPMVLNGQNITYNKNKQITKDGVFDNNRLMDGKAYIYDENGILQRIAKYRNGIYVGDTPIEN